MKQTILLTLSFFVFLNPSVILAGNSSPLDYSIKLFHEARYNEAVNELKKVCLEAEDSRTVFESSYIIGMSYKALGDWKEAADWLGISSNYQPLADYAVFYLGMTYVSSGNDQAAFETFSALPVKFPESRWKEEAGFRASEALFRVGRFAEAASSFERFIKANPKSGLMPQAMIKMADSVEKDTGSRDAYNYYKKIWLNYPASPEARTASELMTRISSNNTDTGASQVSPAIPAVPERYNRVCNLFAGGNYRDGINELVPILKQTEMDEAGRPDWYAEAMLKLGDAYFQVRDDEKAITVLNKLFQAPCSSKILEEALFLTGRAHQRSGNKSEALRVFEYISNVYPDGAFAARAEYRQADMSEGNGNFEKARELYKRLYSDFPKNGLADDSLWKEGWLTYLEKDYKGASLIFGKLLAEYPSSEYADTATYWSARTAEKMGMNDEAAVYYAGIIDNFPLSYYAAISRGRLSLIESEQPLPRKIRTISYMPLERHTAPEKYVSSHIDKGNTLLSLGFKEDASMELSLAEARCRDKGTLLEIAGLLVKTGDYHRAQRIALNNFQEHLRNDAPDTGIWTLAFPSGFSEDVGKNAERNSLNPFLIHAVIREESSYRLDAVSRAGAVGLMQLMPSTGSTLSKERGLKNFSTNSLYISEVNISLGSLYLKKLVEGSKGKLPLAIASYNAGPNAVSAWVSMYGTEEMDEFIERIPYPETRNYVKKVLRSYEVYERLYGLKSMTGKSDDSKKLALKDTIAGPEWAAIEQYR